MKYILFVAYLILGLNSHAVNGKIQGKVKDSSNNEPLEYASVALYRTVNDSLVNGVITNQSGNFSFEKLKPDNYYIQIQFIGYENKKTESIVLNSGQNLQLGEIAISPSSILVNDVIVTGVQSKALNKLEKQTFKADQFESAKGGSAIDVLKNMPSVSVSGLGEISLRGSSGFLFLINGKPVLGDAQNMLSQLPANSIENVELITSPSAKYDPDGKAGIINITTLKGSSDQVGLVVNIQQGLPSTTTFGNEVNPVRYGGDFSFSHQQGKWDITVSGNYSRNDLSGYREGNVYTCLLYTSDAADE